MGRRGVRPPPLPPFHAAPRRHDRCPFSSDDHVDRVDVGLGRDCPRLHVSKTDPLGHWRRSPGEDPPRATEDVEHLINSNAIIGVSGALFHLCEYLAVSSVSSAMAWSIPASIRSSPPGGRSMPPDPGPHAGQTDYAARRSVSTSVRDSEKPRNRATAIVS